ncbi:unnamed protein product [Bursaphelenchus xylophilus]|uniref:(pine wood nematode) hypothetical protein n=1 Tax=Bursaphelenchus xylophilus TaxID=6326 RepID=A0A1I7RKI0_BURXY|nr:unnamed protein product [Bursaphelenchus xylophilus]CAG9131310.1 unnamed protein product [Bursaphelenchus xylophilus]
MPSLIAFHLVAVSTKNPILAFIQGQKPSVAPRIQKTGVPCRASGGISNRNCFSARRVEGREKRPGAKIGCDTETGAARQMDVEGRRWGEGRLESPLIHILFNLLVKPSGGPQAMRGIVGKTAKGN